MNTRDLFGFMSLRRYGVVSSSSVEGTPQSALVGIAVSPDLEIIFDTVTSSRKYANLVARPRCSFVIGWEGEQTVQYEGTAIQPADEELKKYQEVYFAAWPDGPSRMSWPGITYFVVQPNWIRFSDYDCRPPLIEEMSFRKP